LEEKEKSISSKDQDLQSLSDKYISLKTKLEKLSIECDTLKQDKEDVQIELKKYKKDNKDLNEKLKEAEEKLEKEKEKPKINNKDEEERDELPSNIKKSEDILRKDIDSLVEKEVDSKNQDSENEIAQKNIEKEILADKIQDSVKRDVNSKDNSIVKDKELVKGSKSSFVNPNNSEELKEMTSDDVEDDNDNGGDKYNGINDSVVIG